MTKKVIAIISVLKPIDDSRNYEKIATTIGNTNKYDINIIGFLSKKIPVESNTNFYPVFSFPRLSIKRFLAPLTTFRILLKLKPELVIVTCPDLLLVSVLNKIIFGSKIVYDVQENYCRNIVYSGAYQALVKYPLSWSVRIIEIFSSLFIDRFILAEKIYKKQLKFSSSRSIVLENKALISDNITTSSHEKRLAISLLYCGTISVHYGIFEAIELVNRLESALDNISLKVLGYAAQSSVRQKLLKMASRLNFIEILSIDKLVPHDQILTEMKNADFCVLPYQKNKSTEGRIPTKLFECLAMEKPVIISNNAAWNHLIELNNAGIIYDFAEGKEFPVEKLGHDFYGNNQSQKYKWESNASKLNVMIEELLG